MNFHEACVAGDVQEVKRLISQGADLNFRTHEVHGSKVPLEEAIEGTNYSDAGAESHLKIVKLLISAGADVNSRDLHSWPLKSAGMLGTPAMIQLLLDSGADANVMDNFGSALDCAKEFSRAENAKLLAKHTTVTKPPLKKPTPMEPYVPPPAPPGPFRRATLGEVDDVSLQGHVTVELEDIVKCFGDPDIYLSAKTPVSWDLVFDDSTVASIYAWKYLSPFQDEWNIGGSSENAVQRVAEVLGVTDDELDFLRF